MNISAETSTDRPEITFYKNLNSCSVIIIIIIMIVVGHERKECDI
jgi:hypothetical protein